MDKLILPAAVMTQLHDLAGSIIHRRAVWERGFEASMPGGCGMAVLFAGPAGTGKTLAAEAIADQIDAKLVRVDLSRIAGHYAEEAEKTLDSLFAPAADGTAILLFDEADALFGARSDVKDAHDRYANLDGASVLRRIEASNSLAILETNLGQIDPAIRRRLARIITFPVPGPDERMALWQRAFPPHLPTDALDVAALAGRELTGRQIGRAAFEAAVDARRDGGPVTMTHIARAIAAQP